MYGNRGNSRVCSSTTGWRGKSSDDTVTWMWVVGRWCRNGDLWPRSARTHGCVGTEPVQLSWMAVTMQPIHGARVHVEERKWKRERGKKKKKKRVPSFLPLHLNAHTTDDTMQKYGAYWTRLSVQKTLKSSNWWVGPQIQGNHYNNHGDINKHQPEQSLITVLVSKATSSHPTHHQETKTLKKTRRATVPARRNKSGHSHLRTLLLGKVKWCWTAGVSTQREWEGPAVFWRRQRSVQSNLRSHFVSANPRAGLWILMSSCCFCPAQQKIPKKPCLKQTRAGTNTRENFF